MCQSPFISQGKLIVIDQTDIGLGRIIGIKDIQVLEMAEFRVLLFINEGKIDPLSLPLKVAKLYSQYSVGISEWNIVCGKNAQKSPLAILLWNGIECNSLLNEKWLPVLSLAHFKSGASRNRLVKHIDHPARFPLVTNEDLAITFLTAATKRMLPDSEEPPISGYIVLSFYPI